MVLTLLLLFLTLVRGQSFQQGPREIGVDNERGQVASVSDVERFGYRFGGESVGRGETGATVGTVDYGYDYGSASSETQGEYGYGRRDRDMYHYGSAPGTQDDYSGDIGGYDYGQTTIGRYDGSRTGEGGGYFDTGPESGVRGIDIYGYGRRGVDRDRGGFDYNVGRSGEQGFARGDIQTLDYNYGDVRSDYTAGSRDDYGYNRGSTGDNNYFGGFDREDNALKRGPREEFEYRGDARIAGEQYDVRAFESNIAGAGGEEYAYSGRSGYDVEPGSPRGGVGQDGGYEPYGIGEYESGVTGAGEEYAYRGSSGYEVEPEQEGSQGVAFEQYGGNEFASDITSPAGGEYEYGGGSGYEGGPGGLQDTGQGGSYAYESVYDNIAVAENYDAFDHRQPSNRPERRSRSREIAYFNDNAMDQRYTETEYGPYDPYTYSDSESFSHFHSNSDNYDNRPRHQFSRRRSNPYSIGFSRLNEGTEYSDVDRGYNEFFGGEDYSNAHDMSGFNRYESHFMNPYTYRRHDYNSGSGHSFMSERGGRDYQRNELEDHDNYEHAHSHETEIHESSRRLRRPPRRPSRRHWRRGHMFRRPFSINQRRMRQRRPQDQRRYKPISPYSYMQRRRGPMYRTRIYRPKAAVRHRPRPHQMKHQQKHRPSYKDHRRPHRRHHPKHLKTPKRIPQESNKVQNQSGRLGKYQSKTFRYKQRQHKYQQRPRMYRPRPQKKYPPRPQPRKHPSSSEKKYQPRPQKKYQRRMQRRYRPRALRKYRPRLQRRYRPRLLRKYRPRLQKKYQQRPTKKYHSGPQKKYRRIQRKNYQYRPRRMYRPRHVRVYRPKLPLNQGKKSVRSSKQRKHRQPRFKSNYKYKYSS